MSLMPNIHTETTRLLNAYETILNVCHVTNERRTQLNTLSEADRLHNSTITSIAHSILIAKPENREILEVTEHQGGSVNHAALDTIRRAFSQLQLHPNELQRLSLPELQQLCNLLAIVNEIIGGRDTQIVCEPLTREIARRIPPRTQVEARIGVSATVELATAAVASATSLLEGTQVQLAALRALKPTPILPHYDPFHRSSINYTIDYSAAITATTAAAIENHTRAAQEAQRRAQQAADTIVTNALRLPSSSEPTDRSSLLQGIAEVGQTYAAAQEAYQAAERAFTQAPILPKDIPRTVQLINSLKIAAEVERQALESARRIGDALAAKVAAIMNAKTEVSRLLDIVCNNATAEAERAHALNQLSSALSVLEELSEERETLGRAPHAQSIEELQLEARQTYNNAIAQHQDVHSLAVHLDTSLFDYRNAAAAHVDAAHVAAQAAKDAVIRAVLSVALVV